ncbi:MAG: hypothetical protein J7L14_01285 [Candidatus Diapherotrites archaeon]|nr:hypothetical protein [Candidatus Diapherotrites archaeon]
MSVVVLFGAGASYGAGGVLPSAPPLGSSLYRELVSMFPATWGALPPSLQTQFYANFEDGMSALWDRGSHAIPVLMQQMAIFFARYQLSSQRVDGYSKLLDALTSSRKPVLFSSLNYDCLFEVAVSMAGRAVNYFDNTPASDSDIAIWKLHGSCNFLPHGGVTATRGVSFGPGVTFGTGIRPVNPNEVATYCTSNTALYPAMAVYARGKPIQIAPEIIQRIQGFWTTAIKSASTVIIVGAHPHIADRHVWEPLSATEAKLLFVGNKGAFLDWQSKYRIRGDSIYLGHRFDSSIKAIVKNLW